MITTLIADDESHARERLRELLDTFELFDIITEAKNGTDALQCIVADKPQVAFLDINMPGVPVLQSIQTLDNPPLIVFQTAYSEHACRAWDLNVLDYLLKPVRIERLEKTVTKIIEKLTPPIIRPDVPTTIPASSMTHLTISLGSKTSVIAVEDIIRISVEDGVSYLYTATEKLISDKYLNHYEDKLAGCNFFRTSRIDMINLNQIISINKVFQGMYTITLKNGMQVDLSRRKALELKKIIEFK